MSDTPRTDAAAYWLELCEVVAIEFCRQLERENAEIKVRCESLRQSHEKQIAALERENAALREKVDDWENAALHSLDHRLDEQHCTCVVPLVGKVKQLQRENAALREMSDKADTITIKRPTYQTLLSENAALRADKERLDWLGSVKCAYYHEGPCCWRINEDETTDGETIREAIDAARKEKP